MANKYYKLITSRTVTETFGNNPLYDKDKIVHGEAYLTSDQEIKLVYSKVGSEYFTLEEITKKEFDSAVSEFKDKHGNRGFGSGLIGGG
jgi:hypothetical protein